MKLSLSIGLLLATASIAEEFDYHAPINVSGDSSHYQFYLPEAFYLSGGEAWGGDIRVLNADDVAVAFSVLRPFDGEQETVRWQTLNWFPIAPDLNTQQSGTRIEISSDGALKWQQNQIAITRNEQRIDEVVLDTHGIHQRADQLLISWADNQQFVSSVVIESSTDLQNWQSLSAPQTLAQLFHHEQRIVHNVLTLNFSQQRYLRLRKVSGDALPSQLNPMLRVISAQREQWPIRQRRVNGNVLTIKDQAAPHIEFDLGAEFTAREFSINLPEENVVYPVNLAVSDHHKYRFSPQRDLLLYRFSGDTPYQNSPLQNAVPQSRFWRLQLQQASLTWPSAPLQLNFSYEPELVVFAARGPGPYQLRWGLKEKIAGDIAASELMPQFNPRQIPKFPLAELGEVLRNTVATSKNEIDQTQKKQTRWILWAALLLGVGLLAGMVWRLKAELLKQVE